MCLTSNSLQLKGFPGEIISARHSANAAKPEEDEANPLPLGK